MSGETEYTSVSDKIIIEEEREFSEWAVEGGGRYDLPHSWFSTWSNLVTNQSLGACGDERRWTKVCSSWSSIGKKKYGQLLLPGQPQWDTVLSGLGIIKLYNYCQVPSRIYVNKLL